MDKGKAPKPLIEIRYIHNNQIVSTEWCYVHELGKFFQFKNIEKAENYLKINCKYSF